jgi:hypothetical protein
MEVLLTGSLLLDHSLAHTPQISRDLQTKYSLIYAHPQISSRVVAYMGMLGAGLQKHIEHAVNQGNQTFEIAGSITHLESLYPFEIFQPYISEVAQALCPGIQIQFGTPKSARFLAQDMPFQPIHATLPPQASMMIRSGLPAQDILYDVISGGWTTGYMRYPHMYLDLSKKISQSLVHNILLLGAGLMEDPSGSVQCPQLYELGAVAKGAKITVLDNDPKVTAILKANINPPHTAERPMRYDGHVLPYLGEANEFTPPDEYHSLCDNMRSGMERFLKNARVQVEEGDLCTYTCSPRRYGVIVATNSYSNVLRCTDPDPIETKPKLDVLARYVGLLRTGGTLYLDEPALTLLAERLGEGSIDNIILPQIMRDSCSEVSLTRIPCPVEKQDGYLAINSYIYQGEDAFLSRIVSHDIYAFTRGKALSGAELPTSQTQPLLDHMRKSVRFLPKYQASASAAPQIG